MSKKLKILAVVNNLGAVAQVRIISPLKYLKVHGYIDYEIVDISKGEDNQVSYLPDIVILQRLNNMKYYEFFKFLKSKGSKIVFELDDNLLELPGTNPTYDLYSDPNLKRSFLEYIWLADHLIVSTENLKNYYSVYNKSITVVPNQIDEEIFFNKNIQKTDGSNIRIGFAGTITHREDFTQVEQALKEIQLKYKDRINLVFFNMIPESFVADQTVEYLPGVNSLIEFSQRLIKANFDIGLAPLAFNKFNMGKSDIKFLEYGISGIAGVYSNFGPYKRTIKNNETGLFVNLENNAGWVSKLSYLIENPSEIDRIKTNAFNYVSGRRTLQNNYENWLNAFYQITEKNVTIDKSTISKNKSATKNNKPEISIICVVTNNLGDTQNCLSKIYTSNNNNIAFETIVFDNGSKDQTEEYLKTAEKIYPSLKVIRNENVCNFAKAKNIAAQEASSQNLLFIKNYIEPKNNWLEQLLDLSKKDNKIGIIGSKLLFKNKTVCNTGVEFKESNNISNDLLISYANYGKSLNAFEVTQHHVPQAISSDCLFVRKNIFNKVNGFCEDYVNDYDDIDFCLRATMKKTKIAYQPQSEVYINKILDGPKKKIANTNDYQLLIKRWKKAINDKSLLDKVEDKSNETLSLKSENGLVSIIIPVFNQVHLTRQCVESIYNNTASGDFEIIIVDNGSTDGTLEYLRKLKTKDNITIVQNKENLGFARANNQAAEIAKGNFILLLNNDTECQKNWLKPLLEIIENDDSVGAVGSKLLFPDGTIQHAGVCIVNDKKLPDPLVARHIYWKLPVDHPEANVLKTYQALTAACLLIRKSSYDNVGGLDEGYWNGYEDVDFCFKLREKGMKLVYQPSSVVIHHESQSGKERFSKVSDNIKRLHQKWLNVIEPDYIIEENGNMTQTDVGVVKEYSKFLHEEVDSLNKPIVSIVIPTFNQWEYTEQTIKSINKFTEKRYEIIIVDNASSDITIKQLKNYNNVKVIANQENQGFPKAINQGIIEASGDYILIANNDIVLTKNWLERMVEVAESNPEIGIVGPISNSVSGVQIDKTAKYKTIEEMHKHARKIASLNKDKVVEFPRVAFLCTLIKKEVIDKIGGLDERFSPGNFEDDDFCLRAQMAGYKTVIATDVFVHHYGSISFKAKGENEYAERLEINKQKFIEKWGADPEEIWLHGKSINQRSYKYVIGSDLFIQYFERGMNLIQDKEYPEALGNLEESLKNYDQSNKNGNENISKLDVLNLCGNAALLCNDLEKAKKYFEEELQIDHNSSQACLGLGEIFLASDMPDASKTMFEWAVKNDISNNKAKSRLADVNALLGFIPEHSSLDETGEGDLEFVNEKVTEK